jgi:hypothetical protein
MLVPLSSLDHSGRGHLERTVETIIDVPPFGISIRSLGRGADELFEVSPC